LEIIGVFHGDEEGGFFFSIDDVGLLVKVGCVLVLGPEIPR
jgi:hypothetical protein